MDCHHIEQVSLSWPHRGLVATHDLDLQLDGEGTRHGENVAARRGAGAVSLMRNGLHW
jgi:hypothetical protein